MSVNNLENVTGTSDKFYRDEKSDVSFFNDVPAPGEQFKVNYQKIVAYEKDYNLEIQLELPLNVIQEEILAIYADLNLLKNDLELLLSNIYIKSTLNQTLNESHTRLWEELAKSNNQNTKQAPEYISFAEYRYAERTMSTSCRRLLEQYGLAIVESSFSYLYDLRNLIIYIQNEALSIRDILLNEFGETYEDDSQKQTALQFDAWAKMASHFTQRARQTITTSPGEIPASELDKITERQAVEFQAFFSIRLNALHEESNHILNFLKRDYVDNCDIFYERYLSQSLQFKKNIVSPIELDYYTTSFVKTMPMLAQELVVAKNVLNSNFGMIISDLVQRNQIIHSNVDILFKLIDSKRKYSNYIYQLSFKGQSKKIILATAKEDKYKTIFDTSTINTMTESDLVSNHASLDNLSEDHHPQYLLKNGGTISGEIHMSANAKIDGVHLSTHSHSGFDGSEKIKSTDIDYSSIRQNQSNTINKPSSISVVEYFSDIIDGGVPVIDGVIEIEIDDNLLSDENEVIIEVIEI
jgi:hypothetical protein